MSSSVPQKSLFNTDKEAGYLIGAGVAAAVVIGIASVAFDSSDLQVTLHSDKLSFGIRNVGDGPVTILDIGVNDRPDCSPGDLFNWVPNKKFPPKILQVGDSWVRVTPCQVVRVKITTDKETTTFSFN